MRKSGFYLWFKGNDLVPIYYDADLRQWRNMKGNVIVLPDGWQIGPSIIEAFEAWKISIKQKEIYTLAHETRKGLEGWN